MDPGPAPIRGIESAVVYQVLTSAGSAAVLRSGAVAEPQEVLLAQSLVKARRVLVVVDLVPGQIDSIDALNPRGDGLGHGRLNVTHHGWI